MSRKSWYVPALAIALSSCGGDSPGGGITQPPPPPPPASQPTVLDKTELTLTQLGETGSITATSGAKSTTAPAFSLKSENRYLHDSAVLDEAALLAGQIKANAPGTAKVNVVAFSNPAVELTVNVKPSRPVVMSASASGAVGDGDTVRVRGFALHTLGADAFSVGSSPAQVLARDSATALLTVGTLETTSCVSGSPKEPLRVSGADMVGTPTLARKRKGDVTLAVGQALRLTAEMTNCLRLAAIPGAKYALAHFDVRQVEKAKHALETFDESNLTFTTTLAEAGAASAVHSSSAMSAGATRSQSSTAAASQVNLEGDPFYRNSPYKVGDTFETGAYNGGTKRFKVERIYNNHYVLAVAEADVAGDANYSKWLGHMDAAMGEFIKHGEPLFKKVIDPRNVLSSQGSGQVVIMAETYTGGSARVGRSITPKASFSVMALNIFTQHAKASHLLGLLAHEYAHMWQGAYMSATSATIHDVGAGSVWGMEGAADLLAGEVLRRSATLGLMSNWDWTEGNLTSENPKGVYASKLVHQSGEGLTLGYSSAASFLHDLMVRRVRSGESEESALREVNLGALDGWYGHGYNNSKRTGLVARMQNRLGSDWNPVEGVLVYTLSQAIDDLTNSNTFQNWTFYKAHNRNNGFSGASTPYTKDGKQLQVSGTGVNVSGTRRAGSSGYFLIDDNGYGGAFKLGGTSQKGEPLTNMAWMIVRYE